MTFPATAITNWNQAFAMNSALSTFSRALAIVSPQETKVQVTPILDPLPLEVRQAISPFVQFIAGEQERRQASPGEVLTEWRKITELASEGGTLFAPRFGSPWYKFGERHQGIFTDLCSVLDVGCRVFPDEEAHYQYYRNMGAHAIGIDIIDDGDPSTSVGDVRLLSHADATFDFITIASIFGHGNPAPTYLEVAAGISELHRVLGNGLIHIADKYMVPEVLFIAQLLGFQCFINPCRTLLIDDWNGIPVGALLVKRDGAMQDNIFSRVITELAGQELEFSEDGIGPDQIPISW